MEGNKKASQVAGTTSEVKLIECRRCGSTILKSDNYCSYCRKSNNAKTKMKEVDLKLSLFVLLVSIIVLFYVVNQ
ncbi:hypothetical protein [Lysinibacillus capsici]|uniref:hypothetical protein n=1 Tax=Lysinibacillus capsici TaxID=2115968 RepID=UPI003BA9F1A2